MVTRLYVGGIPYETSEEVLQSFFVQAGEVASVNIIKDRETNRSRGFGFVEMASEEGAKKAIELFDGKDFEGRKLTVNEARPLKKKNFSGGDGADNGTWQ